MKVTSKLVAQKLEAYLHHDLSLAKLVDWAEQVVMDGEFDEDGFENIRDVVAQLGVSDVRAFGLTWEGCQRLLSKLGYAAHVEVRAR